jgi:hypothetical protein
MRPNPSRWLTALLLLTVLAVPAGAAVGPLSTEFRVNPTNDFRQVNPVAAFAPSGAALVVWENDQAGIRGRFHNLRGVALGDQLTLVANQGLGGGREGEVRFHKEPAVAFLPNGQFLLAWTEERTYVRSFPYIEERDVRNQDVLVQRFDARGAPAGDRFRVNAQEAGLQSAPELALLANGNALVVWESKVGEAATLVARPITRLGRPSGDEIVLSSHPEAGRAAVAAGRGGFLVTWDENGAGGGEVFGRLIGAAGQPQGAAFAVTSGIGSKRWSAVAAGADGNYLVAWHNTVARGVVHIHGQFLSAAGGFLGTAFQISGDTRSQVAPALAAARGGFIATWRESIPSGLGIRAVELDALGARVGDEIEVTRTGVSKNYRTNVAADGKGGFLVPWETGFRGRRVISARSLGQ